MVKLYTLLLALAAVSVNAAPVILNKRIAQVIADSTAKWETACLNAGGSTDCNPLSITAFTTLLAAAGDCDQQDAADQMIDLAKKLNNDPTMIKFTQIFVQQARNTPNSVAVPYCEKAPRNAELDGLFQCQFQGANQKTFVGGKALGDAGTIPFGLNAPLNPLGSCKAHPAGPIADGTQLTDTIDDPGLGTTIGTSGSKGGSSTPATTKGTNNSGGAKTAAAAPAASSSAAASSSSTSGFQAQNAADAQALNAKFATLTADSACTAGDQACVNGQFAQCVGGKFVLQACAAGTQCAALPLVNKRGTSITCDTQADAIARIQAAGGSASLTGGGSTGTTNNAKTSSKSTPPPPAAKPAAAASSSSSSSGGFQKANALAAQQLNAKFATLTEDSACNAGDNACINGQFAQCVSGKFVLQSCGAPPLKCVALPLVNKSGTSVTCDTEQDAIARIQAAGGSASLTG